MISLCDLKLSYSITTAVISIQSIICKWS